MRCLAVLMVYGVLLVHTAPAAVRYVDKNSGSPAVPYDTPASAATDIQTAVNYASVGETVMVYAATYDVGATNVPGESLSNRVYISKIITVRSVNDDRENTIIKGESAPGTIRAVSMVSGARLIGFTVAEGATLPVTSNPDGYGGGVYAGNSSVISNCIIRNNSADGYGGGVYNGNVFDSLIVSNSAGQYGGGAASTYLNHCLIDYNSTVSLDGAGSMSGTAEYCTYRYNNSARNGGATRGTAMRNCLVYGNVATGSGGGLQRPPVGHNCTIVGNYAGSQGGGIAGGGSTGVELINCIVYSNAAPGSYDNFYTNGTTGPFNISNNCTYPAIDGVNNITNDPKFVAYGGGFGLTHVPGNYRISAHSPCLQAGVYEPWMDTAADLDGNPRVDGVFGVVDMGCYERVIAGTVITIR